MVKYKVRNNKNKSVTTADVDYEHNTAVIIIDNATTGMSVGAFLKDWEVLEKVEGKKK